MAALTASASSGLDTMVSNGSHSSFKFSPSSSSSNTGSVRSHISKVSSLDRDDEENMTITSSRSFQRNGGPRVSEDSQDLRLLATSSLMTELGYSISDVQTRIFEIQELRHKVQSSGEDSSGTTSIIDESLMKLDERLESLSSGMKNIEEALQPLLQSASTPTPGNDGTQSATILRKHEALVADWEAVQEESNVLREELKEDKWLTVFRTVTDQADGMMSSLEKAVNRCQDFIFQVQRREDILPPSLSQPSLSTSSNGPDKSGPSIEVYNSLIDSFEAKKKHYMPATSKVLSIIDKGVQDRVTKNGETLRRHAESAQRWKYLKDRIAKTDTEMEQARKILLGLNIRTPSENGSSTSGKSQQRRGGGGNTAARSRAPSSVATLSRSISPFRKFARKITRTSSNNNSNKPEPVTPLQINKNSWRGNPSSEPTRNKRSSLLQAFSRPSQASQPPTPVTPERPSHKHSYSFTPDNSPRARADSKSRSATPSNGRPTTNKQRWNSSTKVEQDMTIKGVPRRPPSAAGMYGPSDHSPYKRSLSRTSMASSRPWSPVSSSVSTSQSSQHPPPIPSFRPPSRARTPSNSMNISAMTPRPRPKTPSNIPMPQKSSSPTYSDFRGDISGRTFSSSSDRSPTGMPPRPPSRSMIPIPSLKFSSASRPSSAMSSYQDTPSSHFRNAATRAQTPEFAMRAMVQQIPFYQAGVGIATPSPRTARPSLPGVPAPPSSFRDSPSSRTPSRAGSRAGCYTPVSSSTLDGQYPLHEYVPSNLKDPLDVEMGIICNSIAHGLVVERVDPPLRKAPTPGEEILAQYAFSNSLSRKVVTCRLTTLSRLSKGGGPTVSKRVMCRVGGGWQELQQYLLNRQAGM